VPDDPAALPPVIDFEFVGNCKERPPKEAVLRELAIYSEQIKRKFGKDPVLYTTKAAHSRYLEGAVDDYRIWIRDVFRRPGEIDGKPWSIWQYADNVRVSGISGSTDQNVFNGGEADFSSFNTLRSNKRISRRAPQGVQ
jgi:lysozyme